MRKGDSRLHTAVAICLVASVAFAADDEPLTPTSLDELRTAIAAVLEENNTPGVGIALVSTDALIWSGGVGLADRDAGVEMSADHLLRIGSVSKLFVGIAAMQQVEAGNMSLDDRLHDLAPAVEFVNRWEETDPVRLVHLLEHTTGFDDVHLVDYAHNDPEPIPLRDGLALHPHSRTARWRPGAMMSYCTSGPAAVAVVIETTSQMPFESYVEENIFKPLGMETATFWHPEESVPFARGYLDDGTTRGEYWNLSQRPSGAINASANEMARVVRMMLGRGAVDEVRILEQGSVERIETARSTTAAALGIRVGYGLGILASSYEGHRFFSHSGGVNTFVSEIGYSPPIGRGYFFAINAVHGATFVEIRRLIRAFLTHDVEPPELPSIAVTEDELRALAGYYRLSTPRNEIARPLTDVVATLRVRATDEGLVAKPLLGGKVKLLVPMGENKFRGEEQPEASLVFHDHEDGYRAAYGLGGPMSGNFHQVSGLRAWLPVVIGGLVLVSLASSLLFALAWVPRKIFHRMKDAAHLSVRTVPLLAVVAWIAAFLMFALGLGDPIPRLGMPTPYSVGFWLGSLLASALTVVACFHVWRARKWPVRRAVYWHAVVVSLALATLTLTIASWGVVGLKTWAY